MVFYGQDTGCKLQENHDELGVLLPLKEVFQESRYSGRNNQEDS